MRRLSFRFLIQPLLVVLLGVANIFVLYAIARGAQFGWIAAAIIVAALNIAAFSIFICLASSGSERRNIYRRRRSVAERKAKFIDVSEIRPDSDE